MCAMNFLNEHMESEAGVRAVHRKPGSGQLPEEASLKLRPNRPRHS